MKESGSHLSRRSFLKGAGLAAVGVAATGVLAGCAKETPDYLPETWDREVDIVVVGYGGAGAAAAITVASEKLGELLVLEAAPEDGAGGNTRVSMGLMMIPEDIEGIVKYQTLLNGAQTVEEDLIKGWAQNLAENYDWMTSLGIKLVQANAFSPEFPEIEGSEAVRTFLVDGTAGMHATWEALKAQESYFDYEVLYETRATKLVRNPLTNEALGVIAEQGSSTITIKARKGVILSCGGFENNPDMCHNYLGMGQSKHPLGTPFNRGDGIKMVEPFGAQLWHMNNAAGATLGTWGAGLDSDNISSTSLGYGELPLRSYVFVGHDGKRFMYEEKNYNTRHGKILQGGVFVDLPTPEGAYAIFDQTFFGYVPVSSKVENLIGWVSSQDILVAKDNAGFLEKGVVVKAETVEKLAGLINVPAAALQETLDTYNQYCMTGKDLDFGRGAAVYDQFSGMGTETTSSETGEEMVAVKPFQITPIRPPYYATPLPGMIYNTQGGPKRNASGQLLDVDDKPIGRLFGAGEFGAIYSYMYNGGGNVSEAIATGRVAARTAGALAAWDAES